MRVAPFPLFSLILTYCALRRTLAVDSQAIRQIDAMAQEWLVSTGAPSVSIALVQNGMVTYAHAYGKARLAPATAATTSTRYAVDSVSKEFTAAAVLLLVEKGKLSLDDTAGKWFPDLGEASKVTVRQTPDPHLGAAGLLAAGFCAPGDAASHFDRRDSQ